jgi:tetratricopeptide (TPR) repeat protein
MPEKNIERTLSQLRRASMASTSMMVVGALCLMGTLYYSATRLTPLEEEVQSLEASQASMSAKVKALSSELDRKQKALREVETRLAKLDEALPLIQAGTRYLLSRDFPRAIESYQAFLEVSPDSAEVYNFLGYAEFRYAKSLKGDATQANLHFDLAERHLKKAISLLGNAPGKYRWASYNLALLLFQTGRKSSALDEVEQLLAASPVMVDWLCKDGQFRGMRLDGEIGERFAKAVDAAAQSRGLQVCGVTRSRQQ